MSMCICLHLPVLILSVDSDWLISIKVGQSLTGNSVKVGQTLTKSVKVVFTLSKFSIKVRQSELGQTLTKLHLALIV